MDENYQRSRREAINKRPADLKEGLARGGQGLVMVLHSLLSISMLVVERVLSRYYNVYYQPLFRFFWTAQHYLNFHNLRCFCFQLKLSIKIFKQTEKNKSLSRENFINN